MKLNFLLKLKDIADIFVKNDIFVDQASEILTNPLNYDPGLVVLVKRGFVQSIQDQIPLDLLKDIRSMFINNFCKDYRIVEDLDTAIKTLEITDAGKKLQIIEAQEFIRQYMVIRVEILKIMKDASSTDSEE